MTAYEEHVLHELRNWQEQMRRKPSIANKLAKNLQTKLNSYIPEKVHRAITATIKQMVRAVLFGSELTTGKNYTFSTLELTEAKVQERITFYRRAAAAEGGITGAGGILLGFADFPLLLGLKLKMLFEIAALYGFAADDYRERVYLLHIFQLAFSSQEQRSQVFLQLENWQEEVQRLPSDIHEFDWRTFQQEYRDYIDLAKMAQLIPIIGAPIGAVVNYRLINKLGETAMNAYRMRWLVQQQNLPKQV
jgi:uncharacterized protein (DUF697 family)